MNVPSDNSSLEYISLPSTSVILPPKTSNNKCVNASTPKIITVSPQQLMSGTEAREISNYQLSHKHRSLPLRAPATSEPCGSVKGHQITINGVKGLFIPNSQVEDRNLELVLRPTQNFPTGTASTSQTSVLHQKSRRTVGISTSHDVPTEISPPHGQMCTNSWKNCRGNATDVKTSNQYTQTTETDFYDFDSFRQKYLPQSVKYSYNYITIEEGNLVEFRMAGLDSKESVSEWVKELEAISKVHYRVWKTYHTKKEGAYKVDLRCHLNQGKMNRTMKGKDFGCRSMLSIKLDPTKLSREASNRAMRERFRCRVRFRYTHNHTEEESLKHLSVRKDIRDKILGYYEEGMSIGDAYTRHYQDLKDEYGEKFYEISNDKSLCPDKGYFYNSWKTFSIKQYGKVVRPPKPSTPKIPWNKGLKGVTSLREFLPQDARTGTTKRKGELGRKEQIRQAALECIDSTLMESVRQHPETYSRAVSCFADLWKTMDDKDRLMWLQTKIEDSVVQRVMLVPTSQLEETLQVNHDIDFIQLPEEARAYADVVIGHDSQETTLGSNKRLKLDTSVSLADFELCRFADQE